MFLQSSLIQLLCGLRIDTLTIKGYHIRDIMGVEQAVDCYMPLSARYLLDVLLESEISFDQAIL